MSAAFSSEAEEISQEQILVDKTDADSLSLWPSGLQVAVLGQGNGAVNSKEICGTLGLNAQISPESVRRYQRIKAARQDCLDTVEPLLASSWQKEDCKSSTKDCQENVSNIRLVHC